MGTARYAGPLTSHFAVLLDLGSFLRLTLRHTGQNVLRTHGPSLGCDIPTFLKSLVLKERCFGVS